MRTMFMVTVALVLAVSCGRTGLEKEVEQSYHRMLDALSAGDGQTVYNLSNNDSRVFLDRLAEALNDMGQSDFSDGADMMGAFLADQDLGRLSRGINSISVQGSTALLVTEGETLRFHLEDGSWRMDIESMLRVGIEEGLEGTGITVDDILDGSIPGSGRGLERVPEGYTVGDGTVPVTLTNNLGNWDVYAVWIDPSSEPQWSIERLGSDYMLGVGQSFTVMVTPGTYDMRVVDEDGDSYHRWDVSIGSGGYQWIITLSDLD